ncbi:hypothetical protein GCM10017635_21070 [Paracoccus kondratievae]|uniref:Transposase n=1 Tax=Paracoccus kondratievae TaxID=135740 RepID=A0AAD3RUA0_9RHOB|nr:hypothetical protein GCM10017635_21070 [Paracoccus kondratievae]
MLADREYDAAWFRNELIGIGISPCIPPRKARNVPIPHKADLCRQRHKIENMFARLKDWRRIATRYDRSPSCLSPPSPWQLPSFAGYEF